MPKTYDNVKVNFFLAVEQILAFASSISMVKEGKNLSSNFKRINKILRYRQFSFGQVDPFYR